MLGDTTKDGKAKENSFSSSELILATIPSLAPQVEKALKIKTDVGKFSYRFQMICNTLSKNKNDNFGFFWEYYAPYFIEMKDKNFVETFSYIVFYSSGDAKVKKWIKSHQAEITKFFEWSDAYEWKTK